MVSMDRAYFDEMYRSDPDPWGFETSWYEARKYALTVAALPAPRYGSAFEPGCSVGVLSSLLAVRCDRLLATDIVPPVLDRARRRVPESDGLRFEVRAIPEEWPSGPFDLVVLSEIAYYFDRPTLEGIVARLTATTLPGATVVGVHWRGSTNYPLTGDQAHEVVDSHGSLERVAHHLEPEFVLDVWRRV
jgi:hypothetical protein